MSVTFLRRPPKEGRFIEDLNEMLAGKVISAIEPRVAVAEHHKSRMAVIRIHFTDGDRLLVFPEFTEPAVRQATGFDVQLGFAMHPKQHTGARILLPGQDFRW